MIEITYTSGEKKGFELEPRQEKAMKYLLELEPDRPVKVATDQVSVIKSIWDYLHDDYIQREFSFLFSEDFTRIKKIVI